MGCPYCTKCKLFHYTYQECIEVVLSKQLEVKLPRQEVTPNLAVQPEVKLPEVPRQIRSNPVLHSVTRDSGKLSEGSSSCPRCTARRLKHKLSMQASRARKLIHKQAGCAVPTLQLVS